MFLAELGGISIIRGNPLPETVQLWINKHPKATVCGTVLRSENGAYSQVLYLNNSYLIYKSEKIPIENLKVYMYEKVKVPAGTVLVVSGNLEETKKASNPGGFDEQEYYACQHIFYIMRSAKIKSVSEKYSVYRECLANIREELSDILNEMAGDKAAIFQAMLLGEKTELDEKIKTLYQIGGIIHIIAISGLHISMLGMGLYRILKKVGVDIRAAGFFALFFMISYGIMTGNSVSTLRAVCMFVLSVGAKIVGRVYDMPTALALAAVLVLLESPAYLNSSSFQLSFGAVVAVGMVVPVARELLEIKHKWMLPLLSSFTVQIVTLPIVLCAYGEVSAAGIFLNLLVLPTVGIVLGSGVAACLLGKVGWISAGKMLLLPGQILLNWYEGLCEWVSHFPCFTWIAGAPEKGQMICYYGMLAVTVMGCCIWKKKKGEVWGRSITKLILFSGIILALTGINFKDLPEVEIVCLDVGQGDSIVLRADEHNFLIDCGSSSEKDVGQYDLLPFLKNQGISYLDGIFVSHTDKDHISGILELLTAIAERFTAVRVGCVILPEWDTVNEAYREIESLAIQAGAEIRYANAGDRFETKQLSIHILHPQNTNGNGDDTNDDGMVFKVEYKDFCGLFMGDVGEDVERRLLTVLPDVDFLKVGHHGSRYSSSDIFLQKVRPEIAVISCGAKNSYGHPASETVERLEKAGCRIEYTMRNGAISVYYHHGKMWGEGFLLSK